MLHFITKKEIVDDDKKIKKYYFIGCLYLTKEESFLEKNTKLFGIRISHHNLMKECTVNAVNIPALFAAQNYIKKEIDIVISIYNNYEYLDDFFECIQKNTDLPYNLFVVNDCSSDERVLPLLMKWKTVFHDTMVIINNETHLGFVKSVNAAFKETKHDVALMNTDVLLPSHWVSRLFYPVFLDEKIASVTPVSNAAAIFSMSIMGADNNFDGNLEKINETLSKLNTPYAALQVPTGIGFCMAMSRKALEITGSFNESCDRGNRGVSDWCERAIKAGFYNTIAGNVFVWHKHGKNFLPDEENAHTSNINRLTLKKIIKNEAFLSFRFFVELFYLSSLSSAVQVWFDHCLGGGAEVYLKRKFNELKNDHLLIRVQNQLQNQFGGSFIKMSYCYKDYYNQIILKRNDLLLILEQLPVNLIVVNNLVKYKKLFEILDLISVLKKKTGAKVSFRGHDLFCICPTINMLNAANEYCACEDISVCEKCLLDIDDNEIKSLDIHKWRTVWQNFFGQTVDEVIVFSQATFDLYAKYYPECIELMTIIPHDVPPLRKVNILPHSGCNIILPGNIVTNKGYYILEYMVDLLEKYPDIHITVVGTTLKPLNQVEVTGSYQVNDLPELMEKYLADIVFISSVWPETFSYTTTEAISMNLPVACFDLGAPAERVKKYEKGLIISKIDAETAIREIAAFCSKQMEKG